METIVLELLTQVHQDYALQDTIEMEDQLFQLRMSLNLDTMLQQDQQIKLYELLDIIILTMLKLHAFNASRDTIVHQQGCL